MEFEITFSDRSKLDIARHKKSVQKKLANKIVTFLTECEANPRVGTGKPERLKHMQGEIWSREINKQHRFVYEIEDQKVYVLSAWGHYDDK